MKTKMAVMGAIITLLMFQSSFAWRFGPSNLDWRGGWIKVYNPFTPLYIPVYVSYQAGLDFRQEQQINVRRTRNLIRARSLRGRKLH